MCVIAIILTTINFIVLFQFWIVAIVAFVCTNLTQGGGIYGGYQGYIGGYEGLGAYDGKNEIGGGEEHKVEEFVDYHVGNNI